MSLLHAASTSGDDKLYVDDVFTSYLRTGTGADTTVTTNIDMTKGYMLWTKGRGGATNHAIYDSARGVTKDLESNTTAAQTTQATGLKAVSATGHTIGSLAKMNTSGATYVDWVMRKAPKFFDVVTWTGDYTGIETGGRSISHNLGVIPGCIIVKGVNSTNSTNGAWSVWHRGGGTNGTVAFLNSSDAGFANNGSWFGDGTNPVAPTSTNFTIKKSSGAYLNVNNIQYVAYLFAHDPSADGIIQCGSYTGVGAVGNNVTLGWEPQWVMIKRANSTGNWQMADNMRGMPNNGGAGAYNRLSANLSDAEVTGQEGPIPTATGFVLNSTSADTNGSGSTYIYMAIRRPNKPPTSGTSVFAPITYTGNNTQPRLLNFSLNLDAAMFRKRNSAVDAANPFGARLLGRGTLNTTDTSAEYPMLVDNWASNVGVSVRDDGKINGQSSNTYVSWGFKRAPSFMDVVCYTGTGSARTVEHNLTVAPEMMIVKKRGGVANWAVYHSALGAAGYILLNTTAASTSSSTFWQSTAPTSTSFFTGTNGNVGDSGLTYVAYLFATCQGVSKVGNYTGNGTSQTINCGFSSGARFVLIKRTDSTGDWYVWDTARGIVSANDPHLSLNSTAAEVTTDDSVDPEASGFIVNQVAATNINVSGATYIFLSIS
jgi:hypothetical protein